MLRRTLLNRAGVLALGVPLSALPRAAAAAVEIEGVRFEDRIVLGGQELLLNGVGLRAAAWLKAYAAALYLVRRVRSADEVLSQPGPKRVRLVMLRDAPTDVLAKAFDKGVTRNAAAEDQPRLRERLDRLLQQMRAPGEVKKGDAIDLDFDPARGTLLALNARARGEALPGADFYLAVLRSFVGAHPYHKTLRAGLLGQSA